MAITKETRTDLSVSSCANNASPGTTLLLS